MNKKIIGTACLFFLCVYSCQNNVLLVVDEASKLTMPVAGFGLPELQKFVERTDQVIAQADYKQGDDFAAACKKSNPEVIMLPSLLKATISELKDQVPSARFVVIGHGDEINSNYSALVHEKSIALTMLGSLVGEALEQGIIDTFIYMDNKGAKGDLLDPFMSGLGGIKAEKGVFLTGNGDDLSVLREILQKKQNSQNSISALLLILPDGLSNFEVWNYLAGYKGYVISDISWNYPLPFSQPVTIVPDWKAAAPEYEAWFKSSLDGQVIKVPYRLDIKNKAWIELLAQQKKNQL